MDTFNIDTCLSPALFEFQKNTDAIVVVVDILRATSSICTAFANGVKHIIPVESSELAKEKKAQGYKVAAERNGIVLDFADFGNSPFNFSPENVKGQDIVYTTTNGTRTIHLAAGCHAVVIGSFNNNAALANWIVAQKRDVIILCAGWKNRFNIEDTFYTGCLAQTLLNTRHYSTICDSTIAALDMWQRWKESPRVLIDKCAQRWRLHKNNLDDCIDFCLELDTINVVPFFKDEVIIDVLKQ